jgi:hypothetical protein
VRAREEANNLHAHLRKNHHPRYAAYVATTAYVWFCMADNANRATVAEHEAAQRSVEDHLENGTPFDIPNDDIICRYARSAGANLGNPVWMRL